MLFRLGLELFSSAISIDLTYPVSSVCSTVKRERNGISILKTIATWCPAACGLAHMAVRIAMAMARCQGAGLAQWPGDRRQYSPLPTAAARASSGNAAGLCAAWGAGGIAAINQTSVPLNNLSLQLPLEHRRL